MSCEDHCVGERTEPFRADWEFVRITAHLLAADSAEDACAQVMGERAEIQAETADGWQVWIYWYERPHVATVSPDGTIASYHGDQVATMWPEVRRIMCAALRARGGAVECGDSVVLDLTNSGAP